MDSPFVVEFQYSYHVWAVQGHCRLSLTAEALDVLLILRQVRVHDFDGHDGTAAGIAGLIHGGHAAHAYFLPDLVVFQSSGYH